MKILFTFYVPSGGMETLNRIRCEALQKLGIECHLLYKSDGAGRRNIKHTVTHICNDNIGIQTLIRKEKYDAFVVCSDYQLLKTIHSCGLGKPIIYEIQGFGTMENAQNLIKAASPYVQQFATALLYPQTPHIIKLMQDSFPLKPHFCFDNPLNPKYFSYTSYPIRKSPVIAWVGRIEANKNWEEFIEIGHHLVQFIPNLHLWMFGDTNLYDPDEKRKFDSKIVELNLEKHIINYSNIPHEQMADYFSIIGDSGGFLCSTSINEGFGYAVAEAMLCRCPVLTTDSDGVKRFIIHNKTGFFYPIGDIDQAVNLSYQLLNNTELRKNIRLFGEKYIKRCFTTQKYTDHFVAMIQALQ